MTAFTTALHQVLVGYQIPNGEPGYFAKVFKGEPLNLAPLGGRPVARWHVLRSQQPPEGARVLTGKRQTAVVFGVSCYWPLAATEGAQQAQEDDIAVVLVNLPNSFISLGSDTDPGYTIGAYPVELVTVEDTTVVDRIFPFPESPAEMRVLTFEVHARVLEAS